ncbi:MAG TPA: AAA family ATPase [Jatrophihabitantaceae bacterium]|nr:AAA family ATPase [Jatrophihabitantaceae bacterium]
MRLDLVVGPNGAGKSTFIETTLMAVMPWNVVVDADVIAAQRWPGHAAEHAYDAARIAEQTRSQLIAQRRPFIAETVFSHPAKLDLVHAAHAAGFVVALHVLLVPEQLSVARVRSRVAAGGHDVPEEKIRQRYHRLWRNVVAATAVADTSVVYDNAHIDGPREVARYAAGQPVGAATWPRWAPSELRELP